MNKQIKCECTRVMCLAFSMKIINEAQKHEYHFIEQIMKIHFFFKNKLLGICMFLFNPNNMHTYPKHKKSP